MRFTDGASRRRMAINLTSLIDVLFLLVIFVLVTAQFEDTGGITVNLPTGKSKEIPAEKGLVVTIDSSGQYYLEEEKLDLFGLTGVFRQAAEQDADTVLLIRCDSRAASQWMLTAIDEAKQAGLKRVSFQMVAAP